MSADWRRLTRQAGLRISGDAIEIEFADQRRQVLFVDSASDDGLRIWTVVAKASTLSMRANPLIDAWRRNRLTELVGFTVDARGRMIGEAWIPIAGLSADEWRLYTLAVATASDRFEYLLTGSDES